MFDMMKYMRNAQRDDSVVLKKLTEVTGCIISSNATLYFVALNEEKEFITVSLDDAYVHKINLPLRAIQQIITQDGAVIYLADPRDTVYGL